MKTDYQIQKDVIDQLRWEPALHAEEIGVSVKDGVVTLSGIVDTYFKKSTAEMAVKKVPGVRAIAEDLQVGLSPAYKRTDAEIAKAVLDALKSHTSIPDEKIKVKVENGYVSLDGEVNWDFQRRLAKDAISGLPGVRFITNNLIVRPALSAENVKQRISAAFHRTASIDASKIKVEVSGSSVKLTGEVKSMAEIDDAVNAAWSAPGITQVQHLLKIEEPEYSFED